MVIKNNVELIFVTTCNELESIFDLLESVKISNEEVKLLIVIVVQKGLYINVSPYQTPYTSIITINEKRSLSLSLARNIALSYISKNEIHYQYLMFPDDDSTYDELFFKRWSTSGEGNRLINVKYSNSDGYFNFLKLPNKTHLTASHYKMSSSVNMIITRETILATGLFDERLGVGTLYGAGEDNDFFIRANKVAPFTICTTLYNMHPSPQYKYDIMNLSQIVKRFNSYGRGVIFMLCKNDLKTEALLVCIRALGGSVISLLRFRLKLAIAYSCSFVSRIALFLKLV